MERRGRSRLGSREISQAPVDPQALLSLLEPTALRLGTSVAPFVADLAAFAGQLLRWNERINLSGARDLESLAREHLCDALALVSVLPPAPACWIDVGSGAGLPGLILALARRDLDAVLLEPSQKRRAFLLSTARSLGLRRVRVTGERLAEHLSRGGAHIYDLALSRAVFPLLEWLEIGQSLVKPGGVVIGLEGSTPIELPPGAERLPYDVGLGPRAVLRVICR